MTDQIVRCSNCEGLAKNIDASRPFFVCSFCGAQNKNPVFVSRAQQRDCRHADAAAARAQAQAYVKGHQKKYWWVYVAVFVPIMLGGVSFSLVMKSARKALRHATRAHRVQPPAKPKQHLSIDSDRPFPLQVDGDGVEDLCALVQEGLWPPGRKRDERLLACYSGKSFAPLWKKTVKSGDRLWYAADLLLVTRAQHLLAFGKRAGKLAWKLSFTDKIERLGLVEGQLRVYTKDKKWKGVDAKTGKLTAGKVKEPHFDVRADSSHRQQTRDTRRLDIRRPYRQFKGYTVQAAYCPVEQRTRFRKDGRKLVWHDHNSYCRTPYGLADVTPSKGTRIPYFLGYARKSKKQLWLRRLTPELEAFTVNDPKVALDNEVAVAVYKTKSRPRIVELFTLADGKVRWTYVLKASPWAPRGIVLGQQRVYLSRTSGDGVQVFDRESGAVLGRIGGSK